MRPIYLRRQHKFYKPLLLHDIHKLQQVQESLMRNILGIIVCTVYSCSGNFGVNKTDPQLQIKTKVTFLNPCPYPGDEAQF